MDCDVLESKLKLQSYNDVLFQTNTLGKSMSPIILPVIVYREPLLLLYRDGIGIK